MHPDYQASYPYVLHEYMYPYYTIHLYGRINHLLFINLLAPEFSKRHGA